jgi:undecaprenyl-diphosphatase
MLDSLPVAWKLLILGSIQGVSEFLPISSDGHLVLANHFLGLEQDQLGTAVWLHLGTLAATCVVYWREVLQILRGDWRLALAVFIAMIPAGIVGLSFRSFFEAAFASVIATGGFLCLTGAALVLGELVFRWRGQQREAITLGDAVWVGIAQALAILPGVSRSGMTISAGIACGMRRDRAATFSFLLAIPTVGGAVLVEGYQTVRQGGTAIDPQWLLLGIVSSFVVGFIALRGLLAMLRRFPMYGFAIYCVLLGSSVVLYELVPGMH